MMIFLQGMPKADTSTLITTLRDAAITQGKLNQQVGAIPGVKGAKIINDWTDGPKMAEFIAADAAEPGHLLVMKTHYGFTDEANAMMPVDAVVLNIVRDPIDVIVSAFGNGRRQRAEGMRFRNFAKMRTRFITAIWFRVWPRVVGYRSLPGSINLRYEDPCDGDFFENILAIAPQLAPLLGPVPGASRRTRNINTFRNTSMRARDRATLGPLSRLLVAAPRRALGYT